MLLDELRELWFRVRSWARRDAMQEELAEEMRLHVERLEEELVDQGLSPAEARQRAAIRFGNATALAERSRNWWSFGWLDSFTEDLQYAARLLRRSPGFAVVTVLSFALGVGANAAVFTLADRLFWRAPEGVVDADEIGRVVVVTRQPNGQTYAREALAMPEADAAASVLDASAAAIYTAPWYESLGRGADAARLKTSFVSGNFFSLLGTRPARGRFFVIDDDRDTATEVAAVLSFRYWQRAFGGSDSALGRRIVVGNREHVIVGAAPEGFSGVELDTPDLWFPLSAGAASEPGWRTNWDSYGHHLLVRRPAHETFSALSPRILARVRAAYEGGPVERRILAPVAASIAPLQRGRGPTQSGKVESGITARLMGAAGMILVAACANVAILLLVRATARRREMAIRLALGVSRRRLVRQLLLEAMLLAFLGAIGAVAGAYWGGALLRGVLLPDVQWASAPVEGRTLGFALAVSVVAAFAAALVPALRASRTDPGSALKAGTVASRTSRDRLRATLLVAQGALAVMILSGAVLFSRSLLRAWNEDLGFDLHQLLMVDIWPLGGTETSFNNLEVVREARFLLSRVSEVRGTSAASILPFYGWRMDSLLVPGREGVPQLRGGEWPLRTDVEPGYFDVMGIRLLRGRAFAASDVAERAGVTVVNETMARAVWPGESGLGKCFRVGSDTAPCVEVVGVVRDTHWHALVEGPAMQYYLPFTSKTTDRGYVVVRVDGDVASAARRVRFLLRDVRPAVARLDVTPLFDRTDSEFRPWRTGATLFSLFGFLALLLAGIGLYASMAFAVAQRTAEIGIRSALGAGPWHLRRIIAGASLKYALLGCVLGVAGSLALGRPVAAFLYEVEPADPAAITVAVVLVLVVAMLAAIPPARRAVGIDPAVALRAD